MTQVLFIGGAPRSGTTLMERVLARQPGVVALGEVRHLWRRGVLEDQLCGCGRHFHSCPFWQEVGEAAFGGWDADQGRHLLEVIRRVDKARNIPAFLASTGSRSFRDAVTEYASATSAVYEAAAAVAEAEWIIDSSKQVSLPYIVRGSVDDLRVVQMVRDPHGVAYSWMKSVERPEITTETELMPRQAPSATGRTWMVQNLGFDILRSTRVPVLRESYEAFAKRPEDVVARILRFVGVPAAPPLLDSLAHGHVDLAADHTVAGNPLRFVQGRLELGADDEWRDRMSAADRRTVTAWTWPLAAAYGMRDR